MAARSIGMSMPNALRIDLSLSVTPFTAVTPLCHLRDPSGGRVGSPPAAYYSRTTCMDFTAFIAPAPGIGRCDSQIDRGRRMTVNATLRSCAR